MPFGYVEELTMRYFEKDGYITMPNIRFQLDKERTDKKVAGWSDIDLIAINEEEFAIVQCKSFLGTKKAQLIIKDIIEWFEHAIHYVNTDSTWNYWLKGRKIKKYLIIDFRTDKAVELIKKSKSGIEVFYYNHLLTKLIQSLMNKDWRKGKEDDVIIRLLCSMIDNDMIHPDVYKEEFEE